MAIDTMAKALGIALSLYPSTRSWSRDEVALTIEQYALRLTDLEPEVVLAAIEHIGGEWFPALAHVRATAAKLIAGQVGTTPADAWQQVTDAIRKYGAFCAYTNQVEAGMTARDGMPGAIEDGVAQAVVSAIGWNVLCTSENPTADRARFLELYAQKREGVIEMARLTPAAQQVVGRLAVAAGAGTMKQLMNGAKR